MFCCPVRVIPPLLVWIVLIGLKNIIVVYFVFCFYNTFSDWLIMSEIRAAWLQEQHDCIGGAIRKTASSVVSNNQFTLQRMLLAIGCLYFVLSILFVNICFSYLYNSTILLYVYCFRFINCMISLFRHLYIDIILLFV